MIGPHDSMSRNFGLYAGNDLDLFAFYFRDQYFKVRLIYAVENKDTLFENKYSYLIKSKE